MGVGSDMSRKVYTRYKDIIEYLGYRQLDVYRVERDNRVIDIIRIMDPMTGRIAVIDLNAPRESLSYLDFLEIIINGAKKYNLPLNERRIAILRERFKEASHGEALQAEPSQAS